MGMELFKIIAITVAFLLSIFLLIRVFVLWYWKINERLEVLNSIDRKLSYLMPANYKTLEEEEQERRKEENPNIISTYSK